MSATRVPLTSCRVLLVGEDNPYGSTPEFALYPGPCGCSGHRLCTNIMGLHEDTYLGLWRTNLCDDKWSMKAAKERAEQLYQTYLGPWRVIVMLGRKVASAFAAVTGTSVPAFCCVKHTVAFSEYTNAVRTLIALPHPSGRNTVWASETVRANARMILAREVPEVPWGEAL